MSLDDAGRVVVIGSGMGGLTAARLLQMRGHAVTVLEQHTRPGGFLHRFFREGLAYDTGFHYLGGLSRTDAMGQALRHLGVWDELSFQPLDPDGFDRLRFPDLEFRVPVGRYAYRARLVETFPDQADGIHAVLDALADAADVYGLYRMREETDISELLRIESQPLSALLDAHLTDARTKAVLAGQAVLYGVPPHEAPVGLHALVLDHFLSGAHSIEGGGDKLAMALTRKIRRDGGQVKLRARVTGIEVDGRQATGVITEDGTRYEADFVVANLHPRLVAELLPPDATKRAWKTRVNSQVPGHAHMGVYLEVEGRVPSLGRANLYRHASWDPAEAYQPITPEAVPLYFASCPSEHAPDDAPRRHDRSVVLMLMPMAWEQVAPWAEAPYGARPAEYLTYKQRLLDRAVQALTDDLPDLRGRIVRAEASTPLSTVHFTRSPQGAMYGHLHDIHQMGRNRPGPAIRVRNVVLVGQGVFSPGILGATLSAYYGVGRRVGMTPLIEELRSA